MYPHARTHSSSSIAPQNAGLITCSTYGVASPGTEEASQERRPMGYARQRNTRRRIPAVVDLSQVNHVGRASRFGYLDRQSTHMKPRRKTKLVALFDPASISKLWT